eukprot:9815202-Karenia_brevis.AAC.1
MAGKPELEKGRDHLRAMLAKFKTYVDILDMDSKDEAIAKANAEPHFEAHDRILLHAMIDHTKGNKGMVP